MWRRVDLGIHQPRRTALLRDDVGADSCAHEQSDRAQSEIQPARPWSARSRCSALCDPTQLLSYIGCALPARFGIFLEALPDDVLERRRREWEKLADRLRISTNNGCDETGPGFPFECAFSSRHFIEDRTEREDIGARVGIVPFELFGSHVLKCADDGSLFSERLLLRRAADVHRGDRPRKTEVEQFRSGPRQHHIRGFEIAMNDPNTMRAP